MNERKELQKSKEYAEDQLISIHQRMTELAKGPYSKEAEVQLEVLKEAHSLYKATIAELEYEINSMPTLYQRVRNMADKLIDKVLRVIKYIDLD